METNTENKSGKLGLFKRLLIVVLVVILFVGSVIPAYAGMFSTKMVYLQCTIDPTNWNVLVYLIQTKVGNATLSPESRRIPHEARTQIHGRDLSSTITQFSALRDTVEGFEGGSRYSEVGGEGPQGGYDETHMPLTFPSTRRKGKDEDYTAAEKVREALADNLNAAFTLYCEANGIVKQDGLVPFYNAMESFLNDVRSRGDSSTGNYSITANGETYTYQYYVKKTTSQGNSDPVDYITWGTLAYEAFRNYLLKDSQAVREENATESEAGTFEKLLVGMFGSLLDGLRSLLGMWSIDDLVYNQNARGSLYVGGIFPESWESVIWALFTVMEVIAAMMLMIAIIMNVMKKAASTMSTIERMHMMEQIKDIIMCALILALLPVLLRLLISFSSSLTDMAYSMLPADKTVSELVSAFNSSSGTLAGIVGQFLYFGLQVYFNFFYAMRSLTVAILIVLAPLMVMFMMFGEKRKQVSMTWGRELLANVLIQPIHAFLLGIVMLLPASFHSFDNLVALYALIPITSMVRNLFFGSSGSWMSQAAERGKARVNGALAGAAIAGGTALATGIGSGIRNKIGNGGESGGRNNNTGANPSVEGAEGGGTTGPQGQVDPNNADIQPAPDTISTDQVGGAVLGAEVGDAAASAREKNENPNANSAESRIPDTGGGNADRDAGANAQIDTVMPASDSSNGVMDAYYQPEPIANGRDTHEGHRKFNETKAGQRIAGAAKTIGRVASGAVVGAVMSLPGSLVAGVGAGLSAAGVPGGNAIAHAGSNLAYQMTKPKQKNAGNGTSRTGQQATPVPPVDTAPQDGNAPTETIPQSDAESASQTDNSRNIDPYGYAQELEALKGVAPMDYDGVAIPESDNTTTTQMNRDEAKNNGIDRISYDKDRHETSVQMNFNTMRPQDRANAKQLLDYYQSGSQGELSALRNMGIHNVSPIVQTANGHKQTVGMQMTVDGRQYDDAFGVRFNGSNAANEEGRTVQIRSTPDAAPALLPNPTRAIDDYAARTQTPVEESDVRRMVHGIDAQKAPTPPQTQPSQPEAQPQPAPAPLPVEQGVASAEEQTQAPAEEPSRGLDAQSVPTDTAPIESAPQSVPAPLPVNQGTESTARPAVTQPAPEPQSAGSTSTPIETPHQPAPRPAPIPHETAPVEPRMEVQPVVVPQSAGSTSTPIETHQAPPSPAPTPRTGNRRASTPSQPRIQPTPVAPVTTPTQPQPVPPPIPRQTVGSTSAPIEPSAPAPRPASSERHAERTETPVEHRTESPIPEPSPAVEQTPRPTIEQAPRTTIVPGGNSGTPQMDADRKEPPVLDASEAIDWDSDQ